MNSQAASSLEIGSPAARRLATPALIAATGLVGGLIAGLGGGLLAGLGAVRFAAACFVVALLVASLAAVGLRSTFGVALGGLLFGYAALGKGFAYLGAPPVFVGEIVVALGVLVLLTVKPVGRTGGRTPPAVVALWVLVVVGVAVTLPGVRLYGIDALRDSVVWSYALVALAVERVWRPSSAPKVVRAYELLAPVGVVLITARVLAGILAPGLLTSVLINGKPLLQIEEGSCAIQLGFFVAYLVLFHGRGTRRWTRSPVVRPLLLCTALVGLFISVAGSRGGMLGVIVVLAIAFVWGNVRGAMLMGAVVALLLALVLSPFFAGRAFQTDPSKADRSATLGQLLSNLTSSFGGGSKLEAGTREWREQYWSNLIDKTTSGPAAFYGLGFGPNLPVVGGLVERPEDTELRSAHSSPLTIFVRGGVALFAAWVVALWLVLRDGFRARDPKRQPDAYSSALAAFGVTIVLGCIVNSVFDPYLENPVGGIWFWAACGVLLGLASRCPMSGRLLRPIRSSSEPLTQLP